MSVLLPVCARVIRNLPPGDHLFVALLPGTANCPALQRIQPDPAARAQLLARAVVQVRGDRGYAFVDVERPCIVLSEWYYREGTDADLYLDLLHELTHLRQLEEGLDLWDDRFEYVDRPTEVEAYGVAIEEGRRLGLDEQQIRQHLATPWLDEEDIRTLLTHVEQFLGHGVLPNLAEARQPAPRTVRKPW